MLLFAYVASLIAAAAGLVMLYVICVGHDRAFVRSRKLGRRSILTFFACAASLTAAAAGVVILLNMAVDTAEKNRLVRAASASKTWVRPLHPLRNPLSRPLRCPRPHLSSCWSINPGSPQKERRQPSNKSRSPGSPSAGLAIPRRGAARASTIIGRLGADRRAYRSMHLIPSGEKNWRFDKRQASVLEAAHLLSRAGARRGRSPF